MKFDRKIEDRKIVIRPEEPDRQPQTSELFSCHSFVCFVYFVVPVVPQRQDHEIHEAHENLRGCPEPASMRRRPTLVSKARGANEFETIKFDRKIEDRKIAARPAEPDRQPQTIELFSYHSFVWFVYFVVP